MKSTSKPTPPLTHALRVSLSRLSKEELIDLYVEMSAADALRAYEIWQKRKKGGIAKARANDRYREIFEKACSIAIKSMGENPKPIRFNAISKILASLDSSVEWLANNMKAEEDSKSKYLVTKNVNKWITEFNKITFTSKCDISR